MTSVTLKDCGFAIHLHLSAYADRLVKRIDQLVLAECINRLAL